MFDWDNIEYDTYEAYNSGREDAIQNIKRVYDKYKGLDKDKVQNWGDIALEMWQAIKADLGVKNE